MNKNANKMFNFVYTGCVCKDLSRTGSQIIGNHVISRK